MARAHVVLTPRFDIGAGRFGPGDTVYDSWLDGQAERLVSIGLIGPGVEVDDDQVPDVRQDQLPPVDAVFVPQGPVEVDEDGEDHGDDDHEADGDGDEVEDLAAVVAQKAADVLVWLDEHPDRLEDLIAAEEAGKARQGLLSELEARRGQGGEA